MLFAAVFPAPMARMTVDAPVTMSLAEASIRDYCHGLPASSNIFPPLQKEKHFWQ